MGLRNMRFLPVVLLLCVGFAAKAQECVPLDPKTENVAEYLSKIAESLSHIKLQFHKITSVDSKSYADATDALVALKELKSGYLCSANMVGAYKKSKVEDVAKSAEALSLSYQMLGTGVDDSIADIKNFLDGKNKVSPGEKADRDAEKMLDVKKKWKWAIVAIAFGTSSAVGKENPKTKKSDTLIISQAERDKIVKTLKSQFTLPKTKGDMPPIDAAAYAYFEFLNQKWNFR